MKTTSEPMTTKTESELRELDEWIAEHIFGWNKRRNGRLVCAPDGHAEYYTTDPAAAMQVLEKCLAKTPVEITSPQDNWFCVSATTGFNRLTAEFGETLPLAIARFAKALFSK